jgi:hypothetical protein
MRVLGLFGAALAMTATPALATEAKRSTFGKLADGREVQAVTLTNRAGVVRDADRRMARRSSR